MFTGIIEEMGVVKKAVRRRGCLELAVKAPLVAKGLRRGDSVCVNGACLTAERLRRGWFQASLVPETLAKTALGEIRAGDRVNLERALKVGSRLDGHWVLGHVDGVGLVIRVVHRGGDVRLTVKPPRGLMKYIPVKGCVAVEGVSLTVAERTASEFTVALVPFTLGHTTLGKAAGGKSVNVEVDVLARYLAEWQTR